MKTRRLREAQLVGEPVEVAARRAVARSLGQVAFLTRQSTKTGAVPPMQLMLPDGLLKCTKSRGRSRGGGADGRQAKSGDEDRAAHRREL